MKTPQIALLPEAVNIGRALPAETVLPRLEAFSGNALHCWRGGPAMSKYKTVKEVCELTGLTRKHLYYFHHENVVKAIAYANYSVEGHDGYKLYDDEAVEKLQQISLYYQLGLKRDEIRNLMLAPGYDTGDALRSLLASAREKKLHLERSIAALEYVLRVGTANGVGGALGCLSLDELGKTLLALREETEESAEAQAELFPRELSALLEAFAGLDEAALRSDPTIPAQLFDVCGRCLGESSMPFLLGLAVSALGEGTLARDPALRLTPSHGRAILRVLTDRMKTTEQSPRGSGRGE